MPNETHPRMIARIKLLLFAYCAGLVCYLTLTAWRMNVDFYDAFYMLYNAKSLIINSVDPYRFQSRMSFIPFLLCPFYFFEKFLHCPRFTLIAGKIMVILCFAFLLFMTYQLVALRHKKSTALLATFFLSINHLLVFLVPFIKEDIPSALTTTLSVYYYLRSAKEASWKNYLLCSAFMTLTIILRVHMAGIIFPIIVLHEMINGQIRLQWSRFVPRLSGEHVLRKFMMLFVLPFAAFALFFSSVEAMIQKIPLPWAAYQFFYKQFFVFNVLSKDGSSPLQAFWFLVKAFTWPLILCAVIGFLVSLIQDKKRDLIFHIWVVVYILVMGFMIQHKEARYFFPLFIPICLFAARGVEWTVSSIEKWILKGFTIPRGLVWAIVFLSVIFYPLKQLYRAHLRFHDPVYHSQFIPDLAKFVQQQSKGKQIYWVGPMFPLHPKDYVFQKDDIVTYIYHVHEHTFFYYIEQNLKLLNRTEFVVPGTGQWGVFVPDLAALIENGEVLIVNLAEGDFGTKNMPESLNPLIVESVQKEELTVMDASVDLVQLKADHPSMLIELQAMGDGFVIKGTSSVNGAFQLTLYQDDRENVTWLDVIEVVDGRISRERPGQPMPKFNKGFVLSYKLERLFFHP